MQTCKYLIKRLMYTTDDPPRLINEKYKYCTNENNPERETTECKWAFRPCPYRTQDKKGR